MKTRDEILSTWDEDGIYADWYAIDSYNPTDGVIRRLFVGTEDEAYALLNSSYIEPKGLHGEPFYRIKVIGGSDAKAFFEGEAYELPDERELCSATEAAEALGVSRMRVNQLINDGKLPAYKVGNAYVIDKADVERKIGYFAMHHAYGTRATSDSDTLIRFGSREERDAWVDADKWDGSDFHRRSVDVFEERHDWENGAVSYEDWRTYLGGEYF